MRIAIEHILHDLERVGYTIHSLREEGTSVPVADMLDRIDSLALEAEGFQLPAGSRIPVARVEYQRRKIGRLAAAIRRELVN